MRKIDYSQRFQLIYIDPVTTSLFHSSCDCKFQNDGKLPNWNCFKCLRPSRYSYTWIVKFQKTQNEEVYMQQWKTVFKIKIEVLFRKCRLQEQIWNILKFKKNKIGIFRMQFHWNQNFRAQYEHNLRGVLHPSHLQDTNHANMPHTYVIDRKHRKFPSIRIP